MKLVKNIYLPVTLIVAGSLFVICFAEWKSPGAEGGWRLVSSLCGVAGAVGVIWLGWCWLKLTREITSMAVRLKKDKICHIEPAGNLIINELGEAINSHIDGAAAYKLEVEKRIQDLQIQLQLSQKQKKNIETIIYGIRDAVIVIDEFDRLLMANEAAGKLFGFDFKSSQHRPISELIDSSKSEFVDFIRQSKQNKVQHTKREIRIADSKGPDAARTFDCIISCVCDQKERAAVLQEKTKWETEDVCGVVAVLHDITREKEISQMKSDFVNHVSHELKAPLASITAYSEMLLDDEVNDEDTRKEFYSVIQSQAKRLNRLIEDILNTSRIESGLIKVRKEPVSLTILIEEQLQMIKGSAAEKNISLSWGTAGQKPIVFDQVSADRDMISQVIVNLLSNAVKYTPSGGSISVKTEVDEIAGLVCVRITDTGVGIPENEIEHVFDKFYRVNANNNQAKGTGLGLNLVKQIIEKVHNGRVFVKSKPGQGSTFGFELPLATAEAVKA